MKITIDPADLEDIRRILKRFLDDTEGRDRGATSDLRETAQFFLRQYKVPKPKTVIEVE